MDFDGVIHDPDTVQEGKRMGQPYPGTQAALESLIEQGYKIIIYTLRGNDKGHVADWMDHFELPYHRITNTKPDAAAYIDDKAIRHVDWNTTLADIAKYLPKPGND